jgi:hypothetical protein
MAKRRDILVLSIGGDLDGLPGRLLVNHFRGRTARSVDEAEKTLASGEPPIHAGMLGTRSAATDLPDVGRLQRAVPRGSLRLIAAGEALGDAGRAALRAAGVDYLLPEPFSDTELRFVVNQAIWDATGGDHRGQGRVPTDLVARIQSSVGSKVATVYSLSVTGAYLETPRPSQERSLVEVSIPLPSGAIQVPAKVVSTNVTGNLRRENLPRGMGVQFENPSPEVSAAISRFVKERLAAYRP